MARTQDLGSSQMAAYMAGFFDGEGTFRVRKASGRYHPGVMVINTNLEVINLVAQFLDQHDIFYCFEKELQRNPAWKQSYRITVGRIADVFSLCMLLLPYLVVKRKQAELLMQFPFSGGGTKMSEHCHSKRRELYVKASQLNKKGAPCE